MQAFDLSGWMVDPNDGRYLEQCGVPSWKVQEISIADIDLKTSGQNLGHLGLKIDEMRVAEYAKCMEAGDVFCAIKVIQGSNGKYLIVGGNHRARAAAKIGCEKILAIVLDASDAMAIEIVARTDNNANGRGVTHEHRVIQAVYLVQKFGLSVAAACEKTGISVSVLSVAIRVRQVEAAMYAANIPRNGVSDSALDALHGLLVQDPVFRKVARIVCSAKLAKESTLELVRATRTKRTESEKLKMLDERAAEMAVASKATASSNPRRASTRKKFLDALRLLTSFLEKPEHASLAKIGITTDEDLKAVREKIDTAVVYLNLIKE